MKFNLKEDGNSVAVLEYDLDHAIRVLRAKMANAKICRILKIRRFNPSVSGRKRYKRLLAEKRLKKRLSNNS